MSNQLMGNIDDRNDSMEDDNACSGEQVINRLNVKFNQNSEELEE